MRPVSAKLDTVPLFSETEGRVLDLQVNLHSNPIQAADTSFFRRGLRNELRGKNLIRRLSFTDTSKSEVRPQSRPGTW